jgi:hypothetical protein
LEHGGAQAYRSDFVHPPTPPHDELDDVDLWPGDRNAREGGGL